MRIRMTEHDESIGAIFAANNKLAKCIDVHIEVFRKELYHSLERTKSSKKMRDSQLRDLMKRFDEYVAQQNVRMQKFAVDSVALRREIEARVSNSRPASEPTKHPQFFDMTRDDGMFSHAHPHRDHVSDVADLRDVASDLGGPLFPQGVVEHVPPGSLLNPIQRRPEHGGCVAALAPIASTVGGSETDVNSVFAAAASARSRNEADLQFMTSLPQKSSLFEQYMRTLEEVKRGPVPERRSNAPSASQAAPAASSSYVCERVAPNLQFPVPTVPGMPLKPSAAHDPAPTGCVGTFPCQVRYDPRAAPTRAKASKWVESMLGKSQLNPPPSVQESIAAASAQTHIPHDSLRHIPPPHQSQYHAGYIPGERVDGNGQDGAAGVPNASGTGSDNPTAGPPPPSGGGDGWGYVPSQGNPGGGAGPPGGGGGGGGPPHGSGPPNPNPGGLLPPDDRAGNAPNPDDVDCERCGCRTTRARATNCVSCRFRCCPNCCRDPLNICRVCAERATGVPPNQAAQNPGGNQGDGGGDRKAKCKPIKLDPEPEPSRLRRWIVDMKEKVANAFSHDIQYAMQWVEIPDDATYDALAAECRYGMLENELNSALRESIKAVALRNKIQAETGRMHTLGRRLMSRQILWLMYDHLRPHIAGDNTFKIIELTIRCQLIVSPGVAKQRGLKPSWIVGITTWLA